MSSEELKPCPFCGGDVQFHKDDECSGCHYIQCGGCRAFFDFATSADPENNCESVDGLRASIAPMWNRRAETAALAAERERLADELDRKSVITGDYIARCQRLADERDALAAELAAIKGQELRADPVKAQLLEALEASNTLLRIKRHACGNTEVCRVLDTHITRNSAAIAAARKEGGE